MDNEQNIEAEKALESLRQERDIAFHEMEAAADAKTTGYYEMAGKMKDYLIADILVRDLEELDSNVFDKYYTNFISELPNEEPGHSIVKQGQDLFRHDIADALDSLYEDSQKSAQRMVKSFHAAKPINSVTRREALATIAKGATVATWAGGLGTSLAYDNSFLWKLAGFFSSAVALLEVYNGRKNAKEMSQAMINDFFPKLEIAVHHAIMERFPEIKEQAADISR